MRGRCKRVLVALAALAMTACIRVSVPDQPNDWPRLSGMSSDCREVTGAYVDPNTTIWDHIDFSANGRSVSKTGAHPQLAWSVLRIPPSNLDLEHTRVRSRSFTLRFADGEVVIDYRLDHEIVETVHVSPDRWTCTRQGLILDFGGKTGQVVDKLPSAGADHYEVSLYRYDGDLYVKASSRLGALVVYALPLIDVKDAWYRFPVTFHP